MRNLVKPAGSSVTFLLVEDDDDHAQIVRRTLERGKIANTIFHAKDGEEALCWLRSGKVKPDIILLDIKMPKVDGHEVLRQVKADESLQTIPVVVLSTSESEVDRMRAYKHQANSYLVKPIDVEKFRNMVEDLSLYWSVWNVPARSGEG